MRRLCMSAVGAVLIFASPLGGYAQNAEYRLQPTDVISITVHGHPDLSTKTRVSSDGYISFPLIGKIFASGSTVQQLESTIKTLLEKDYLVNAQVLVFIEEYHLRQVSVMGEVKSPGKHDLPNEKDLTLMQVVAMAGGFTKEADLREIRVIRIEDGVQRTITVNAKDITVKGEKEKDIVIEPGDVVSVPQGFSRVSVIGEVNKPGTYDMPQEKSMTLLEAVAMAGGFTKHAEITRTRVMRTDADGRKTTLSINVKDITERGDKDKDIEMEPDDLVVVPESFF